MSALLEIKDLEVAYGKILAVKGISFTVGEGEVVCLIGTNGAGKTTTLRTISGLLRPKSGEIWFQGTRIDKVPAHEIVSLGVAHSPEGRRIFPRLTVEENLLLGAFSRNDGGIKNDLEAAYDLFPILRERAKQVRLPAHGLELARINFIATPQLRLVLDDAGLKQIIPAMLDAFDGHPPDIIVIDPIRNVFDGGDAGGENDNGAMMFFLSQRVDPIRQAVNPDAGVILAHHTRKLNKKQFEEDPFQALAGASSLRGFYTTGVMLDRPNELSTIRRLTFELRNGPAISQKSVDKIDGEWRELDANNRLVLKDYGERLDAERRRKRDAILEILFDQAAQGRCYTANQFAESFEGKAGLGGERTIRERISALSTQGYIKFFRNAADYGLSSICLLYTSDAADE